MKTKNTQRLSIYLAAILLSFEIMLSFSSFGYVSVGNWTLSFVPIGIYAMAFLVDIPGTVLAGLVFGLSSMWTADIGSGRNLDYLYSPVLSGNPASSIVLAIGTRLFMGLIAGIALQKALKCKKHRYIALAAATTVSQTLYTAVSLLIGVVLFPELDTGAMDIGGYAISLLANLIIECIVFSSAVIVLSKVKEHNKIRSMVETCRKGIQKIPNRWAVGIILGMTALFAAFSIGAVLQNLSTNSRVLEMAGVLLNNDAVSTLLQVEFQQMCSTLALFELMVLIAMIMCSYFIEHRDELIYQADRDRMTGLYNREAAKERFLRYRNIHKDSPCTFVIIDIDDFKMINDTLGHAAGDEAIMGVANVLKSEFRQSDIVARIGGDEFIAFVGGIASPQALTPILERIQNCISDLSIVGVAGKLHVSIGARFDPTGMLSFDDLYRNADVALYRSKANGKNTITYFE